MSGDRSDEQVRNEIERWFLRRGAPHFIEGYRATTKVWTRAVPALAVLWVAGMVVEVGVSEDVGGIAFVAGVAAVIGLWVVTNLIRRRRAFAPPDTIGAHEVAFVAVSPALLAFALERDVISALTSIAIGAFLLTVVYLTTSYGLFAITGYVVRRLGDQLALLGQLSSRAVPLLLLITVTIFLTGETWQMSSRLVGASQVATLGLFVVIGGVFLLTRVPGAVRQVEQFGEWSEVTAEVQATPAKGVRVPAAGDPVEPAMSRGQRINLIVMAMTTQAVQITLVALAVYAFFVLLGVVAVHPETAQSWIGEEPRVLVSAHLGQSHFAVTEELLRVSAFLAAFAGLAFTVYLVTDATYRTEFASDVSEELREVMAVRLAYLHHLETTTAGEP